MIYDATGTPLRRGIGYRAGLAPSIEPKGKAGANISAIGWKRVPEPVMQRRAREGPPKMRVEEKSR